MFVIMEALGERRQSMIEIWLGYECESERGGVARHKCMLSHNRRSGAALVAEEVLAKRAVWD